MHSILVWLAAQAIAAPLPPHLKPENAPAEEKIPEKPELTVPQEFTEGGRNRMRLRCWHPNSAAVDLIREDGIALRAQKNARWFVANNKPAGEIEWDASGKYALTTPPGMRRLAYGVVTRVVAPVTYELRKAGGGANLLEKQDWAKDGKHDVSFSGAPGKLLVRDLGDSGIVSDGGTKFKVLQDYFLAAKKAKMPSVTVAQGLDGILALNRMGTPKAEAALRKLAEVKDAIGSAAQEALNRAADVVRRPVPAEANLFGVDIPAVTRPGKQIPPVLRAQKAEVF